LDSTSYIYIDIYSIVRRPLDRAVIIALRKFTQLNAQYLDFFSYLYILLGYSRVIKLRNENGLSYDLFLNNRKLKH
jgi:hypothetical protein